MILLDSQVLQNCIPTLPTYVPPPSLPLPLPSRHLHPTFTLLLLSYDCTELDPTTDLLPTLQETRITSSPPHTLSRTYTYIYFVNDHDHDHDSLLFLIICLT
jgi:hypothetical protein